MSTAAEVLADRAKEGGLWHWVPDSFVLWDQRVFEILKAKDSTTTLYFVIDQLAHKSPGIFLIVALFFWLFWKWRQITKPSRGTFVLVSAAFLLMMAGGNALSDELKLLFGRLKPHLSREIPGLKQPLSFPSNHSFNTAAILGFWFFFVRSWPQKSRAIVIATLALLWIFTSWTRLYLGEHFPLDVLGGFGVGILYGFYGAWLLSLALSSLGKRTQK